jgi:nitrogen fixation NifU-like protein
VGSLPKDKVNVGTGLVGAPACGDVMKLQIEVDENNRIVDAKFKTFGCGSAIASSSLVTEMVKGRSIDEAMTIKNADIAKELRLPPVKIHCSCMCPRQGSNVIALSFICISCVLDYLWVAMPRNGGSCF